MVETVIPNFCTIDLRTSSDTIGGIIAVLSYWKKVRGEREREGDIDEEDARMANERGGEKERERMREGKRRVRGSCFRPGEQQCPQTNEHPASIVRLIGTAQPHPGSACATPDLPMSSGAHVVLQHPVGGSSINLMRANTD